MPLFGSPNIDKLREKGDVRGLIKALEHKHPESQRAAAIALGRLGSQEAVDALISLMGASLTSDSPTAAGAAEALGMLGGTRAKAALIRAWMNPDCSAPEAVADALKNLGRATLLVEAIVAGRHTDAAIDALAEGQKGAWVKTLSEEDGTVVAMRAVDYLNRGISSPVSASDSIGPRLSKSLRSPLLVLRWIWSERVSEIVADRIDNRILFKLRRAGFGEDIFFAEELEAQRAHASRARRERVRQLQAAGVLSVEDAVAVLVDLYDAAGGEGFEKLTSAAEPIRTVGQRLHESGGLKVMLEAHTLFAVERPLMARNLEMVWDGIGTWAG